MTRPELHDGARRFVASKIDIAAMLRVCTIVAVYFVLWLTFDRLSYHYSKYATPWYLATGLSFYVLYAFGLRYAPVVVAVEVIRGVFSSRHYLTYEWLLLLGVATTLCIVPFVYAMRRMRLQLFARFSDTIVYLGLGCVLLPLVRALVGVAIICASGSLHWPNYWRDVSNFGIGDLVGMATLVPFLVLFVSPIVAPARDETQDRPSEGMRAYESVAVIVVLLAAVIVGYGFLRTQNDAAVYLIVFLPLTWLVVRGGLRWGVVGLLLSDVAIVLLQRLANVSEGASAAYQSYIAASSFTVLTLGAAINQRHSEEREAVDRAQRDAVTGLPSRQALEASLASPTWDQAGGTTLLAVEFEAFRLADEWLDPQGADALQASIAERLRENTRTALMLAHASSNAFAIVLSGSDERAAVARAEMILAAFVQPVNVGETELYVTPTIGVAAGRDVAAVALFNHAMLALRNAASRGKGQIVVHDALSEEEAVLPLVAQLHRAYKNEEFLLYFQPIFACDYDAESGVTSVTRLVGAEALLRWNHPDRGMLEPGTFLDLLESMPLSKDVGAWVFDAACRTLAVLRYSFPDISMWINLFSRQAFAADATETMERRLRRHAIPADAIVVELNEKMIAEDEAELEALVEKLHRIGVRVAVDDFGTGGSSYARLREASIDVLKIDKSFIPTGDGSGKMGDVLLGLLKFARDLGVTALAEGVETPQQCSWLTRNDCTNIQGFALGPPLPSYAFAELVERALNTRIVR